MRSRHHLLTAVLVVVAGCLGATATKAVSADPAAAVRPLDSAVSAAAPADPTPTTVAPIPTTTTAPAPPPSAPLAPAPPADGRDAPDPFILRDGDRWVLYSTQVGWANVPAAVSDDLVNWSTSFNALPELPAWAEWGSTWAPGVVARPGGYVLYFAARSAALGRQCIGAAFATQAAGPFVSPAAEPIVCQPELGGSIDPHPFVDDDGQAYLLWKADGNAIGGRSILFSQRLAEDGLGLVGEPAQLIRDDAPWERPLIENPALVRLDGRYGLVYSGGWWEDSSYAVGHAVCDTPLGPCTKVSTEAPTLGTGGGVAGPGGATVLEGPAGDLWFAYHGWDSTAVGYDNGGARSLRFAQVSWDGSHLSVR